MNKNEARNHHYVPQFYLAGFSKSGSKKAKLHVYDKIRKKHFEAIPRVIAAQRDFNRIDVVGKENEIEDSLAKFEGKVGVVFDKIKKNGIVPKDDYLAGLLHFICSLALRNPVSRENSDNFQQQICEMILNGIMESPERFKYHFEHDETYEEMKEFNKKKEFKIKGSNHHAVLAECEIFKDLLPAFLNRKWSFFISNQETGEFVTSDHPVSILSKVNSDRGFGNKNTEVVFPVSKFVAMIGVFENPFPLEIKANPKIVANINYRTVNFARNQIYSAHERFNYLDTDGVIKDSISLLM